MIKVPIYWTKTFKTKPDQTILVGMNWYRNAHYHDQSKWKREFHEIIDNQCKNMTPIDGSYILNIKIYYKNAACDGSNISSLIEKAVLDALQSNGILVNDNVNYHLGTVWGVAGQDKENPRAEIEILPTQQ